VMAAAMASRSQPWRRVSMCSFIVLVVEAVWACGSMGVWAAYALPLRPEVLFF